MAADADDLIRTLFKGGSILFVGLAVELVVSFVAKVIIATFLGPIGYGSVSLGITTATVLSTLTLLGVNVGIARYLPRYDDEEQRRGVLVSGVQIAIPLALLVGGIIVILSPYIAKTVFKDPSVAAPLRIFGIAIPLAAWMKLSVGVIQGLKESLPKVYIQNLALPLGRLGAAGIAVALGLGAVGIAWSYVFSYLLAGGISTYILWKRTNLFNRSIPSIPMRRELLGFSFPLVISAAMTLIFSDIDTFMLGYFSSTGDVGIYNTVYPLAYLLTATITSFSFVFMPVVSELHENRQFNQVQDLYKILTKWIFVLTFPGFVLLALFPTQIIGVTFGSEFVDGSQALIVLAAAFFTHSVTGPNINTLTSIGRTRTIMGINAATALLNIILNLVLIPSYSYIGAAVATAASYVLLNLFLSYTLYRITKIHPISRQFITTVIISFLSGAALWITIYYVGQMNPFFTLASIVACGIVYLLGIFHFTIDEEEIMLLLSFEERFGVSLGPFKQILIRLNK